MLRIWYRKRVRPKSAILTWFGVLGLGFEVEDLGFRVKNHRQLLALPAAGLLIVSTPKGFLIACTKKNDEFALNSEELTSGLIVSMRPNRVGPS